LLLAALDETSRRRRERYEAALDEVRTLPELVTVATTIFREDLEAGHVRGLSELIAASASAPELGPAITERIAPWIDFTQGAVERVMRASPVASAAPSREVAYAIVALYLGLELLTQLDGDREPALALFGAAANLANLFAPLLGAADTGDAP